MGTEITYFDIFLKYGLFLGGIFQLICILALVFVPSSYLQKMEKNREQDCDLDKEHYQNQKQANNKVPRKGEKLKKRR